MRKVTRAIAVAIAALGLLVGAASPSGAAPSTQSTRQLGYTQVTVAPDTLAALTSLGVTPGVIEPGRIATADPLAVQFPISGYRLSNLRIQHQGGVSLSAGATTVTLSNFNIDLARLRVSGDVGGLGRVDLFKIRFTDRFDLGLVKLVLTAEAASALNATFGIDALTEDFLFGYATPRPFARF